MRDRTHITHVPGVMLAWCEFCGRSFWTNTKRNRHIKRNHPEVLPKCKNQTHEEKEN